jgi:hypothetical protein
MDDRRFDRLTRALARGVSRRRVVAGLMASVSAGALALTRRDPAAAQPYSVPLGDACYDTIQCSPSVSPRIEDEISCADNLLDYDGALNCCRWRGGQCWDDGHCCSQNWCIRGYCYPPEENLGSLRLGESCGDPGQCTAGGLEMTCADNGIDYGGVCCTFYGNGCGSDRHCCGSLVCLGQVCTVPYEGYG